MPRENLLSLLADFAEHARDVAVVQPSGYRRQSWLYGNLLQKAGEFAIRLKSCHVRTGDRVLLWAPNSAQWIIAFWGILLRGAVAVPMDETATIEFAQRVVLQAAVKVIVAHPSHPRLTTEVPTLDVSDLADRSAQDCFVAAKTRAAQGNTPWHQSLSDEAITRDHLAQILFTSGTTAEPRGVLLTHGNFLANLEPLEKGIGPYRKYERWLHPLRFVNMVPLSHVFGQFMSLMVPPLLGATVILEPSTSPRDILRTIKRERATALVAVPRILELIRKYLQQSLPNDFAEIATRTDNLPFLRRAWQFRRIHARLGWMFWAFICGGAALPAETEDFLKRIGYAVVQGYGMTETASLISLNHPFRATKGSIGRVLPGRQVKLASDGEILVRGENVSPGYWQNRDIADPSSEKQPGLAPKTQGWLHTGDLGELDSQGNLRFRGRKKNVIVTSSGLNIHPDDLESALRKQPQIQDCIVIPARTTLPGQEAVAKGFTTASDPPSSLATEVNVEAVPCAVLLIHPSEPARAEAAAKAIGAANASLADYQQIRSWFVWPDQDFPRTSTGKPRQTQIAARVELLLGSPNSQSAQRVSTSPPSSLAEVLSRFSSTPTVKLDEDLNLSSLDRVELLSTLESQFHVELNQAALAQARTVSDVQALLTQRQPIRSEHAYPHWAQREPVRWLRRFVYYTLVWPATFILAHPKVLGREHLKNLHGPGIVISNHITRRADIGLILYALPRRYRDRLATAMGGETLQEMRRPPKGWFAPKRWLYFVNYWLVTALFNVFPLPQFSGFRESFEFAGDSVDRGYSVLVFPEGAVNETKDGRLAKFQPGIGLLAQNLQLPIIPMRLDGVAQMKQSHRRFARLGELTVRIGAPVTFPRDVSPEEIASKLETVVLSLGSSDKSAGS